MARTAEGTRLTEQHRAVQLEIRSRALRDFMRLWPLWNGDEASFRQLIAASLPLTEAYHNLSASTGASYYERFRALEGVGGSPTPRTVSLDRDKTEAGFYATGLDTTRKALAAGKTAEAAMETALVMVSGSLTRQVLNGGRLSVVESSLADRQAGGWARVTAGNPCAFCAMLAGRGPVYSEDTVDFSSHDHCACGAEPHYRDSAWPGRGREFKEMYNRAVKNAKASGDLRRGTSNDLLNAFRREFDPAA